MIEKLINEALAKEQAKRAKRERSGCFSPSMFGRCYRAQVWNRKNEKVTNKPDSRALRIFRAGRLFHDFVQGFIVNHKTEVKCEKDDVLGYADVVTADSVADVKSMHSKGFWYMDKEGYDVFKEKYNNWLQVGFYAWVLDKKYASLVFISKDDLCIREFSIVTEKLIPHIKDELHNLREWWAKSKLAPPLPRAYGGKECKYCGFQDKCKKE